MSIVRKVDPAEAADWDLAPCVLDALLARNAGADSTGLTRIDRNRRRYFSINKYGGWGGANAAAEAGLQEQQPVA